MSAIDCKAYNESRRKLLDSLIALRDAARSGEPLDELNESCRKAFLQACSQAHDSLEVVRRIEYGWHHEGLPHEGFEPAGFGFKLKSKDISVRGVLLRLTFDSVPDAVREAFPDVSVEDLDAMLWFLCNLLDCFKVFTSRYEDHEGKTLWWSQNLDDQDLLSLREDLHLVLHRENYLQEPDAAGFRSQFVRLAGRLVDEQVGGLLVDYFWEMRLVGMYCVLAGRRRRFEQKLRDALLDDDEPTLRRPACLALFVLGAADLASDLAALVERPFNPEHADNWAAVIEALRLLGDPRHPTFEQKMLRSISGTAISVDMLRQSAQRFRAAVELWMSQR